MPPQIYGNCPFGTRLTGPVKKRTARAAMRVVNSAPATGQRKLDWLIAGLRNGRCSKLEMEPSWRPSSCMRAGHGGILHEFSERCVNANKTHTHNWCDQANLNPHCDQNAESMLQVLHNMYAVYTPAAGLIPVLSLMGQPKHRQTTPKTSAQVGEPQKCGKCGDNRPPG